MRRSQLIQIFIGLILFTSIWAQQTTVEVPTTEKVTETGHKVKEVIKDSLFGSVGAKIAPAPAAVEPKVEIAAEKPVEHVEPAKPVAVPATPAAAPVAETPVAPAAPVTVAPAVVAEPAKPAAPVAPVVTPAEPVKPAPTPAPVVIQPAPAPTPAPKPAPKPACNETCTQDCFRTQNGKTLSQCGAGCHCDDVEDFVQLDQITNDLKVDRCWGMCRMNCVK